MSDGSILSISIYRSPDIKLPASFSFPDETGGIGSASLLLPAGTPEQLTGEVTFRRVEQGVPVEGEFEFLSETGGQFKGRFKAEWENQPVYCG